MTELHTASLSRVLNHIEIFESGIKTRTSIWISSPLPNKQECSVRHQTEPNRSHFALETAGPFSAYFCSSCWETRAHRQHPHWSSVISYHLIGIQRHPPASELVLKAGQRDKMCNWCRKGRKGAEHGPGKPQAAGDTHICHRIPSHESQPKHSALPLSLLHFQLFGKKSWKYKPDVWALPVNRISWEPAHNQTQCKLSFSAREGGKRRFSTALMILTYFTSKAMARLTEGEKAAPQTALAMPWCKKRGLLLTVWLQMWLLVLSWF